MVGLGHITNTLPNTIIEQKHRITSFKYSAFSHVTYYFEQYYTRAGVYFSVYEACFEILNTNIHIIFRRLYINTKMEANPSSINQC